MAPVSITNASKVCEGGVEALRGVSLDCAAGRVTPVLGSSRYGRTPVLNTVILRSDDSAILHSPCACDSLGIVAGVREPALESNIDVGEGTDHDPREISSGILRAGCAIGGEGLVHRLFLGPVSISSRGVPVQAVFLKGVLVQLQASEDFRANVGRVASIGVRGRKHVALDELMVLTALRGTVRRIAAECRGSILPLDPHLELFPNCSTRIPENAASAVGYGCVRLDNAGTGGTGQFGRGPRLRCDSG